MDLDSILEDLAAGRIDQAEAARRIDRLEAGIAACESPAHDEATAHHEGSEHRSPADEQDSEPQPDGAATEGTRPSGPRAEPSWGAIARDLFGAASEFASSAASTAAHTVESTWAQAGHPGSASDPEGLGESPAGPSPLRPTGSHGVEKVSVRATGRRVRILGDRSVATLAADGPHVLRRNGSVLEVTSDGELGPSLDGFNLIRPPRNLDDLRTLGLGKELLLRVNPDILVEVEVTAGSLTTTNVPWLGKVRVTAGSAHLGEVVQITDALVQAGSAKVRGRLDRGRSRVRVESGNLVVELAREADVEVRADAQLGRVSWPGGAGQMDSWVAGSGSARLDIGIVMGAASIHQEGVEAPQESTSTESEEDQR
ncbi:hypothetical protein [Luteococcus peritonei]|uniref:Adhesin domain-containing protein n=1 Tax=Luteococcus peritonei TaxID=88874 RepID=A0ABW4RYV1_9ACTN